jgi:hypothetical protein
VNREGCASGKYGDQVGQKNVASCKECKEGYYCTGIDAQLSCPPGKYGDQKNQNQLSSCKNCEKGYYCPGSDERYACGVGKYGNEIGKSTIASCKTCEKGFYCCGTEKHDLCQAEAIASGAPRGAFQCSVTEDGPGKCQCQPGKYGTEFEQINEATCKTCEEGFYCTGGAVKSPCGLGKYSVYTKVDSECKCDRCPEGKYGDITGALSCKFCPPGKTNDIPGQTSITTCYDLTGCPAGKAYNELAQACEHCRDGLYNPSFLPAIQRMEKTKTLSAFLNGSTGQHVSYGTFAAKMKVILKLDAPVLREKELRYLFDRVDADDNNVLSNLELATFNDGCLSCPRYGAICNQKGTKIPHMKVGFWREDPAHPDINKYPYYKCLRKKACPGGNGSLICNTGYDDKSAACSYCSSNYVLQNNQCNFCIGKEAIGSSYTILLFFIFLLGLVIISWYIMTQPSLSETDLEKLKKVFESQTIIDLSEDVTPKRLKAKRSSIDFGQVRQLARKASRYDQAEIKEIFSRMDVNENEEISRAEIEQFVGHVDESELELKNMKGIEVKEGRDGSVIVIVADYDKKKINKRRQNPFHKWWSL